MAKNLTAKQKIALDLLTSGEGLDYKEVAARADVNPKTLWRWRNEPEFAHFQEEMSRRNNERWQAAEDAARQGAIKLCKDGNQKMIEFVLKNAGYGGTTKIEAELHNDIVINIEE